MGDAADADTIAAPLAGQDTPAPAAPPLVGGRYEILAMLGSGGMGTVYRARDRELDEIVALKSLKKELAAADGMLERFRREVKLARRVTHKNVARTFDIGGEEGERYLTMELVEGEMLGAHLARRGRVPPRDVIRIGQEVCAGLAAAHAAGVLHRDLKPENVILAADGRAVITDFGIARAVENEAGRTMAGAVVGTPAYMAPEQVEGALDLDGRADLYALGAMLFELLTGQPAWTGTSAMAIAAARLLRPPPDLCAVAPELPAAVGSVVAKLMARSRDDRYASAEEAGAALAELGVSDLPSTRSLAPSANPRVPATRSKLAVLPLLNHGSDDDDFVAETLAEDLVDLLSVVPELRVRPLGDAARFSDRTRDARAAGRELGVDVVVDGSIRRVGELVRVSVRLVTVEDGFQLWARRFDGPPAQVTHVADTAASAIATALQTERKEGTRPVASDPAVEELYLRGRFFLHRGWFEHAERGVALLREARERAPDDTRIAGTYAMAVARVKTGGVDYVRMANEARELAEQTLLVDPEQVDARVALGYIHLNDAEGASAATQLKRALQRSPSSIEALDAIGRMLVEIDRIPEGVAMLRRVAAMDPSMVHSKFAIARSLALMGDFDAAYEMLGPLPVESVDQIPYLLHKGRFGLWHGVRPPGTEIADALRRGAINQGGLMRIASLHELIDTRRMTPEIHAYLEESLAIDERCSARRNAFHCQIRVEVKLAGGMVESALTDLMRADTNGLLDIAWLDRCGLFDGLREQEAFVTVRQRTGLRAERVSRVLDV